MNGYDSDWARDRIESGAIYDDMTAPDRPGDPDQQQAADYQFALGLVDRPGVAPSVARELAASVAAALAAARVDETARHDKLMADLRALHSPVNGQPGTMQPADYCREDGFIWPCPTRAVLDADRD